MNFLEWFGFGHIVFYCAIGMFGIIKRVYSTIKTEERIME